MDTQLTEDSKEEAYLPKAGNRDLDVEAIAEYTQNLKRLKTADGAKHQAALNVVN